MRKKTAKTSVIVILALCGYLPLGRPVGSVLNSVFPRSAVTYAATAVIALGLSSLIMWLLFTKWSARFWIKVVIAAGAIILGLVAIHSYDMTAAYNMTHPK